MSGLTFADAIECYEAIGHSLASAAPGSWKVIVVDVELEGIEVTIIDQYQATDGQYYEMPLIPTLGECFYRLARLVSSEQKGFYKKCRYILEPSGKYHADFVY
jgi:hypothetical protein